MITHSCPVTTTETALRAENVNVYYGKTLSLYNVNLEIIKHQVTAFIGPSGCGKSTLLRCFNRLNDLILGARVEGQITFHNLNLYDRSIDPVEVRRRIGIVFQKPNPFPKSIYENVAFGARVTGYQGDFDQLVEEALKGAALWDEVKDKLKQSGLSLSGGQQQRLCIARAIAVQPEVILMDEPCSALDPIATLRIENLIDQLKQRFTIVIVTHNMQQASRIADYTAFFNVESINEQHRCGVLVEYDRTEHIFNSPAEQTTQAYISGCFG